MPSNSARASVLPFEIARAHALSSGCCGNAAWRGRFCPYHQGMEDGIDAYLERRPEPEGEAERFNPMRGAGSFEKMVDPYAVRPERPATCPTCSSRVPGFAANALRRCLDRWHVLVPDTEEGE